MRVKCLVLVRHVRSRLRRGWNGIACVGVCCAGCIGSCSRFSGRLGRGKSDAMAGAFGVSGVSDSLDTPPIGAIGTEGAAAGRAAGMDGSGVFHADTVCSIRADRAEFPGRFSDTRKFSSACFSACPSFDVSCSPMSFRAAEFRQLTALSCMFHDIPRRHCDRRRRTER